MYDCLLVRLKSLLVINAAYLQIKLYSIISRSFCFTPRANESLSLLTRESGCCIKKQASIGLCASISYSWESPGEDECWLLLKVEGWRCSLAKAYFIVNYFSESERCFKIDVDWESNFLEYDLEIVNFSHTGQLIVILEFRIQFFDMNFRYLEFPQFVGQFLQQIWVFWSLKPFHKSVFCSLVREGTMNRHW